MEQEPSLSVRKEKTFDTRRKSCISVNSFAVPFFEERSRKIGFWLPRGLCTSLFPLHKKSAAPITKNFLSQDSLCIEEIG